MPGVAVLVGVDGDGRYSAVARGADDANRNLAAIGNQDLCDSSHSSPAYWASSVPLLAVVHKKADAGLS